MFPRFYLWHGLTGRPHVLQFDPLGRALVRIGWGYEQSMQGPTGMKKQIITLLHAARVLLTIPLMGLNLVVIVLKLLMG